TGRATSSPRARYGYRHWPDNIFAFFRGGQHRRVVEVMDRRDGEPVVYVRHSMLDSGDVHRTFFNHYLYWIPGFRCPFPEALIPRPFIARLVGVHNTKSVIALRRAISFAE